MAHGVVSDNPAAWYMSRKILIMAGGTGGHIFPGLAVADWLKQQGWEVCWLGTKERMEARLVPEHGYPIRFIDVAGVRGNGLKRLLLAPVMILRSMYQAIGVIRQEKPAVVLGMGGYASGPGGVAAWMMGKPVVLHEQNAVAGVTNRILAHFARKVLMAFPGTFADKHQPTLVGNPVRQDICQLTGKQNDPAAPLKMLIVGGSLGAKALNEQMPPLLAELGDEAIEVWHQTGKGNLQAVTEAYQGRTDVRIDEFISDMTAAYDWADMVICRAGALTVAEVAAAGLAAVFVPYPHAVDDHQTVNAGWLADSDAAIIIQQNVLDEAVNKDAIKALLTDRKRIRAMGEKAAQLAIRDATDKVAKYCIELAK